MKKTLALLLALVMLFAMFAACGKKDSNTGSNSDSNTGTNKPISDDGSVSTKTDTIDIDSADTITYPSDDATFKFAMNTEIGYLTQTGHAFGSTGTASLFFGESLLRWNSDTNEVEPFIAESWEWIDDVTLRVKIRDDVTSINGDPFTAHDVIFSWQWGNETAALKQYFNFFDYDKTKAVDDYTVDFVVNTPYPFLPLDLCHGVYHVACEKSVNDLGGKDAMAMNPNACTGPYKMTKLDEVSQVCYAERREDYWGIMPYYKYLEIYSVTDANTRAMGIEAGDYNFAMNPSAASVSAADGKTSKAWYVAGAGRFASFSFNTQHEPLNVKEIRQAIALAINYDAVLAIAGGGNGILSDSAFSSPLNPYSYTEATDPDNCYLGRTDVELAKQKLTEAGYADGFSFKCNYKNSDAVITNCAELVKNQLAQIGIDLELSPVDAATFTAIGRTSDWDSIMTINGNPNPKRTILPFDPRLDTASTTSWVGTAWAPTDIDVGDIIDRCLQTVDDDERMKAFTEMNDICREYVPQIILYCPFITFLSSSDIVNVPVGSQGGPDVCRIFPAEYIEG